MSGTNTIIPGSSIRDSPPPLSINTTASTEPISPRSAAVSLHQALSTNDHEAVDDIAQRLLQTLSKKNDEQRILSHILEQRTSELLELRGRIEGSQPVSHCPPGFELNGVNKAIYFCIPIQDGYSQQAHWVQRLPNGQITALPEEYTPNQKPYVGDLFAEPTHDDDDEEPIMPMPNWLHNALTGPAAGCSPLFTYANQHLTWGIAAELYRYRQAHADITSAENQIESLKAQVRCCKEVQAGARSRMEMAYVEKKLSSFRTVGTAFGRSTGRPYARRANQPARVLREEEN